MPNASSPKTIREAKALGLTMERCEANMRVNAGALGRALTDTILRTQPLYSLDEILADAETAHKTYKEFIDLLLGQRVPWDEI